MACRMGSPIGKATGLLTDRIFTASMAGELDLFSGWKIGRLARKIEARIIHCHTALAHSLGLMAKLFSPVTLVVTRRVDFPLNASVLSPWKYRRTDHIIAISSRIRSILLQNGVAENRISLIPSGLVFSNNPNSESTLSLRMELNIPQEAVIIGTVAALVGHKDYPTLIEAFNLVIKEIPNAVLLMLGEGDERPGLEKIIARLGLQGKARLLGFRKDVVRFFGLFDVYVQSSKMEGLCSSLIEAMHHRLSIAATSAGGIPDLIEDGVTGILVNTQSPSELAAALVKLLKDKDMGKRLAEDAHLKSKNFSAEKMVERTEEVYLKLLKH